MKYRLSTTLVLMALALASYGGAQDLAPVTLVLVADTSRMQAGPDTQATAYADAAFISQNVYLFCASEGLATGVRMSIDRPALARALKLRNAQVVVFAQSVGFPKK